MSTQEGREVVVLERASYDTTGSAKTFSVPGQTGIATVTLVALRSHVGDARIMLNKADNKFFELNVGESFSFEARTTEIFIKAASGTCEVSGVMGLDTTIDNL